MKGSVIQMIRRIRKGGLFTGINLLGLAMGLACCMMLGLYIYNECSVDRFHKHYNRIAFLQQFAEAPGSGGKLAEDFTHRFSQVEKSVRLIQANPLLKTAEAAYYDSHFFFADSSLFDVFSFKLLEGNPRTALKEKQGIVLTVSAARKFFPKGQALGKTIRYDNKADLRVTGIMEDLPSNAHQSISCLASISSASELMGWDVTGNYWGGSAFTYLLLKNGTSISDIESQFPAYLKTLNDSNAEGVWKLRLIPLKDLYLRTSFFAPSPITTVFVLSLIGLFIISLACFNYINLATATSLKRARETGVRKVLGASRTSLRSGYLIETATIILCSLILAIGLVVFLLPAFNQLAGKQLQLQPLFNIWGLVIGFGVVTVMTIAAGFYPAFVLSAFQPSTVFKGEVGGGRQRHWLSKGLLTLQFVVSMAMIIATIVVYDQLDYVQHKDAGYQRAQVLTMDLRDADPERKQLLRQELKRLSSVESASISFSLPGSGMLQGQKLVSQFVPQAAKDAGIRMMTIDEDYLNTYGISLVEGRMLSTERKTDETAFLINEAAKKYFGWNDISGKMTGYYKFSYRADGTYEEIPFTGEVVGVIKDYHHANLKAPIEPMILALNSGMEGQMGIRLKAGAIESGLGQLEAVWKKVFPDRPFEYAFLDNIFNQNYRSDQRTGTILGIFSILAIFISLLGLFGLVAHQSIERKKEIAIRRVLGADISEVLRLLSREFTVLMMFASLLAFPIAWFGMNKWLENYAYRIDFPLWVFPVSMLAMAILALTTISLQVFRVSLSKPVASITNDR